MGYEYVLSLVIFFYFDMLKMGVNFFFCEFCNLVMVLGNNGVRNFD